MSATALIVYESMFGNTERIARAIRDGLRQHLPAETVPVNRAPNVVPGGRPVADRRGTARSNVRSTGAKNSAGY